MDLKTTIQKVRASDTEAFTQLVKEYQNLALAYAFSILKDFHRAEDAAQEAFIVAYYQLGRLKDPEAFPGWLKGIVRNQCYRVLRGKKNQWVSLDASPELADAAYPLEQRLAEREERDAILAAIRDLPERQREAVSLFYIEEHSQREVAAFLGIGVSDVNNSLHAARKTLKRSMAHMVDQTMKTHALPKDFAEGIGKIIQVRGNVVEAEIDSSFNTLIFDTFKIGGTGDRKLSVVQRLNNGRVRCLLSGDIEGLKPNARLKSEPERSLPTLEADSLRRAIESLGTVRNDNPEPLETGIKVIDLMCPFPRTGNAGLISGSGVGKTVVVHELFHRLAKKPGSLSLFAFCSSMDPMHMWTMDRETGMSTDESGAIQVAWLVTPFPEDPELAYRTDYLDTRIFLSPVTIAHRLYPAIDTLRSYSVLLDPGIVGEDHCAVARNVREVLAKEADLMRDPVFFELMAVGSKAKARERLATFRAERLPQLNPEERSLVERARKLKYFFTQPFYVAEPYHGLKGAHVSLDDTLQTCRRIVSGDLDEWPAEAFFFTGSSEDVAKRFHDKAPLADWAI
jgi:RNA polymerase sigma factor (sigma-70 family)